MTVSEKHIAEAKRIAEGSFLHGGSPIIDAIAASLAAAEREGMMRAEAICYDRSKAHHKQSKTYEAEGDELSQTQCLADAVEAMNCAANIRDQAGEA